MIFGVLWEKINKLTKIGHLQVVQVPLTPPPPIPRCLGAAKKLDDIEGHGDQLNGPTLVDFFSFSQSTLKTMENTEKTKKKIHHSPNSMGMV